MIDIQNGLIKTEKLYVVIFFLYSIKSKLACYYLVDFNFLV